MKSKIKNLNKEERYSQVPLSRKNAIVEYLNKEERYSRVPRQGRTL